MKRESTAARGYGSQHQAERKRWEVKVKAGGVMCARQGPKCTGQPLDPDQPFDLGHNDDRTGYNGPECIPCNRGEGAKNSNAVRMTVTREW